MFTDFMFKFSFFLKNPGPSILYGRHGWDINVLSMCPAGYGPAGSLLGAPGLPALWPYLPGEAAARLEMHMLHQLHKRKRRHRTIFTDEQLGALEELFEQNQYPDVSTREQLARRVHLREERVEVSQNAKATC